MKRKFLILTLCFTIMFSSLSYKKSYATPLLIPTIRVETANIILGVAASCGIVLTTQIDKLNFLDSVITKWVYTKSDSGDFTTYPTIEDLEEHIKNNSNKDPNSKEIFIFPSLVDEIVNLFDELFSLSDDNGNVIFSGDVPIYPKYIEFGKKMVNDTTNIFRYSANGGKSISFKSAYQDNSSKAYYVTLRNNAETVVDTYATGGQNLLSKGVYLTLYPIDESKGKYCFATSSSWMLTNLVKFTSMPITIPITSMQGYAPNKDIISVPNNNISSSVGEHDNINIDGNLDIPEDDSSNPPSNVPSNPPKFPDLNEIDFGSFDFSSLGSLFDNFKNKFPFSIPFDIYNIIKSLYVEPIAPKFELPVVSEVIELDLTEFDELANIIRMFVIFGWVFVLFSFTKKLGG